MAKIELHILNPEQFDTLQKVRDFVTGRGAEALHYAIEIALQPWGHTGEDSEVENRLQGELKDARAAAVLVSHDLGALARGAIESESDPEVFNDDGFFRLDMERRALLFIAMRDDNAIEGIQLGIIEYLGGGSAAPES